MVASGLLPPSIRQSDAQALTGSSPFLRLATSVPDMETIRSTKGGFATKKYDLNQQNSLKKRAESESMIRF